MADIKLPLKDRLHDWEMLVETVSTDVRSSGIIVTDLSQVDVFKFAHKSFFELVVASNFIYTCLALPLVKDKLLHHAAKMNLEPSSWLFLTLSNEMIQFAAEILYRLAGGAEKNLESERTLVSLGIPIKSLRRIAFILAPLGDNVFTHLFTAYVRMYLVLGIKQPLAMLSVLAAFYETRGQGGEEFIKYEVGRARRIRLRMERLMEQHQKEVDPGGN